MVHHTRCPLCLSERISGHLKATDHFLSKEVFEIIRCSNCGFLFTQDYPDEKEIYKYYDSEEYISHSGTSKGILNKIYHLIRLYMLLRKKSSIKKTTGLNKGNILDIGSGTGHFLSVMKKAGWSTHGIEINEKARKTSSDSFGLDILAPSAITSLSKESFDCVTLWHVLEHLHDPLYYLSSVHDILKSGGFCVVALPNSSSPDADHYGKFWAAYDVPRHLWHFVPATFSLLAEKSELRIIQQTVLPFDVFYISLLSEKYRGSTLPYFRGLLKSLWFSLLTCFNRNKGSSIVYFLQKTPTI